MLIAVVFPTCLAHNKKQSLSGSVSIYSFCHESKLNQGRFMSNNAVSISFLLVVASLTFLLPSFCLLLLISLVLLFSSYFLLLCINLIIFSFLFIAMISTGECEPAVLCAISNPSFLRL